MTALEWESIDGTAKALDTRFGVLTVELGEQCPGTREPAPQREIRIDGRLVQSIPCLDADYYLVSLKNAFEIGPTDVVLLGESAGGSGSPPQRLHLIILSPGEAPRIEMDPSFRSVDGTQRVASANDRIWFDLGFDAGERKVASVDETEFRLEHMPVAPTAVPGGRCEAVHSAVLQDCIFRGRATDFTGYSFEQFLNTGLLSTASRNSLSSISQHPGFSGAAFRRACVLAAESGEAAFRRMLTLPWRRHRAQITEPRTNGGWL